MAKAKAKVKVPSAKSAYKKSNFVGTDSIIGSASDIQGIDTFKPSGLGISAVGPSAYKPSPMISANMPKDLDSVAHTIEKMEMVMEPIPEQQTQPKPAKKATVKKKGKIQYMKNGKKVKPGKVKFIKTKKDPVIVADGNTGSY